VILIIVWLLFPVFIFSVPMKRNKKKGKGKRKVALARIANVKPPHYQANTRVSKMFRFQYSYPPGAPAVFQFTPAKVGVLNVVAATTILGIGLYEYARIRRLRLYAAPTVDASVVNIAVTWNAASLGIQGDDVTLSDESFGMTDGAYLDVHPPKGSQSAQWQGCTTGQSALWFTITVASTQATGNNITVTLDLDLDLQCTTDSRTSANSIALTTATVGDFYYMALDNVAPGGSVGNKWIPDRILNTTV
jgi:hypothetical protein